MQAIGWIPVDPSTGEPYRSVRSPGEWRERKEPIKVYRSEKMAQRQSGKAAVVYIA